MQDLRVIKTEKLIKDSFYKLVDQKGFEQLTITDICNDSLIGRSTFYQHYVDKYELLEKENIHYTSLLQRAMDIRMKTFDDPESLKNFIEYLKSDSQRILLLFSVHAESTNLQEEFERLIGDSLDDIIKDKKSPVSNEFIKKMYASNVLTFIKWSLSNGIDSRTTDFMNESFKSLMSYWFTE
ncbi:TetR/AcrR family transcriptional regulator [Companilactobacillus jidongensis]|uniref:TetR/AcrR family transcriptional regulator n=1 Tax=Companilactobacillus jidongensis TaxID=2486006 RepID=UPI0013DE6C7B|nr:TetR family transcriptional regulator [Companilactobacillus jidongensis]